MTLYCKNILLLLALTAIICSCKKIIQIPPPVGTITTSQVFTTDDQATSAVAGMYFQMINSGQSLSKYGMSVYGGMSADELIPFNHNNAQNVQFQQNSLISTNAILSGYFWNHSYSIIYQANAIIEGLKEYSGVHDSLKTELIGEAEFIRAFYNFYLINLFGDIPLVTTINWRNTNLLSRMPVAQVYQQIVADLIDAQNLLSVDYSMGNGQRIVPNKWAATALLARVYLYMSDWGKAEEQASLVINNTNLYHLTTDLNQVFLANSSEAIWQLQQSNDLNSFNATPEGALLIPGKLNSNSYPPFAFINNQLLSAFEPGDQRRLKWIDSTLNNGVEYYFPYKYKIGNTQATVGGTYSEYYMALRLAEQYLIRAEARIQQNKLSDAASDIDTIRNRAGLPNTTSISQTDFLAAIAHERQVELFIEWGHRWLDLKRTNQATNVLRPIKPLWAENAKLYPIPRGETSTDPNLTQNPGYY
jgi:starch-binding outer membrane protein, SusD/RagB family